jgi:serine/threonine protein kinase
MINMGQLSNEEQIDIRLEIEEQLAKEFHFEGTVQERNFKWRGDTLLLYLSRNSDNSKLFMKIPFDPTAERVVDATYRVHKLIPNKKNIEPVLEDEPRTFKVDGKTRKAILMERAEYTLSERTKYFNSLLQNEREGELFDIIVASSSGLQKAHEKGIIHKDIKESNLMKYPLGWGVGDFGFSSISNIIDVREGTSDSIRQHQWYLDYELFATLNKDSISRPFGNASDIFSLGVILYAGTEFDRQAPLLKCRKIGREYTPEAVIDDIENSQRSDKIKYFLKRMLGPRNITGATGQDRLNYRYSSLSELLKDASGGQKVNFDTTSAQYKPFLDANESFIRLLNKEKYMIDSRGLMDNKSIDKVVTAYEELQQTYKSTNAESSLATQKKFLETCDVYNAIRYDEEQKIENIRTNIPQTTDFTPKNECIQNLKDYLFVREKTFLWGPPFTNAKRTKKDEKARYTYDETVKRQTFYHPKFDEWMRLYNK